MTIRPNELLSCLHVSRLSHSRPMPMSIAGGAYQLSAGASPQTPLGELTAFPRPSSWI